MRAFCDSGRTGKPMNLARPYAIPVDPPPEAIAGEESRSLPKLRPSVGTLGTFANRHVNHG